MFHTGVLRTLAAFAALALPMSCALADAYPSRAIALVVPFSAGGPTDTLAPAVQALPVDYLKDFEPVALVATNPQVIVSRRGVPANNLQELVAWVKGNPGKVSYASGGAGTPSHIMAVEFSQKVATLNIVHYRGAAPAMQDVVAGHVAISRSTRRSRA